MVTFGKTDVCLLIAIVASISYLYLTEDKRNYVIPDVSEPPDDFDVEETPECGPGPVRTSARDCCPGSSVGNSLVVDYSDSNANDTTGERILNALFTVRKPS